MATLATNAQMKFSCTATHPDLITRRFENGIQETYIGIRSHGVLVCVTDCPGEQLPEAGSEQAKAQVSREAHQAPV